MALVNIFKRRMKVFTMALVIYIDYKALKQREKWISKTRRSVLWEKAHERNAKRVLSLMIELEGLWVKLGQYLSTRADVLPGAYISLLKQLQDSLPPRPLQEVCRTIKKELGKSMEDLFSDFMETPLATASIAQVHCATLLDGREVVVKVQHEAVKTIILEDLKNAKAIIDWIAWVEPQYDFNPMIDEWCKEAPKELDFNHEAENTRTVYRNLGCRNQREDCKNTSQVNVMIPEVIQSTEKVLILEYMDGIRLNDSASLEAFGIDKQIIIEEITRAYAHQIYVDGFFNGDPHPGNFLVSKASPHRPILLDFGFTKKLSSAFKLALAKMFLASAEGDHAALLSAFIEMGLKFRLDMPEQVMSIATVFFRTTTPADESTETVKSLFEQREKNMKVIQEKMKLNKKEVKRFNPVDAVPGDIVIFTRVLQLLRGLSAMMNVRISYFDIMRPFAEAVLQGSICKEPNVNKLWIYDTPVHSDVEAKLRQLLVRLRNEDKILGIQVCAYKDGKVIIDTAAGFLGRYDPRPVQPDSLFSIFSVTKGITAGMMHWLVDKGKLELEENVADVWPEFGSNGKDNIKVHHVLNHSSGLHNAMKDIFKENPLHLSDWNECLSRAAKSVPETQPGHEQLYHYISYGWLCGGIIEKASGKKFQEILEEAFIHPLQIEGELYIGIPPGVESQLATLTLDRNDLNKLAGMGNLPELPSSFQPENIAQLAASLPVLFNMLSIRRAIIPAANGHCSARALARYYAALADGGLIPPPHSSSSHSLPPLGSHTHIPKFPPHATSKKQRAIRIKGLATCLKIKGNYEEQKQYSAATCGENGHRRNNNGANSSIINGDSSFSYTTLDDNSSTVDMVKGGGERIFTNPEIHDAFMGVGKYEKMAISKGKFGLGFKRLSSEGTLLGFGHSGMGGSTGFCDPKSRFAIAVTLNKMSFGGVTSSIVNLVCSELGIPLPDDLNRVGGLEEQLNFGRPLIN